MMLLWWLYDFRTTKKIAISNYCLLLNKMNEAVAEKVDTKMKIATKTTRNQIWFTIKLNEHFHDKLSNQVTSD